MLPLSVVIIANKVVEDTYERHTFLVNLLNQYKLNYNVIYVCTTDYADKENIASIVANTPDHSLIVTEEETNLNSMIYAGITKADGNDVLLMTTDTNENVISEILAKRKEGYENVYVRKRQNQFVSIFTSTGMGTYHLGQLLMGRELDICNDANVMLIDAKNVDTIAHDPELSKVLRITNQSYEKKYTTIKPEIVHDQPTLNEQKPFNSLLSLGVASIAYYIALFFMACIFPIFNNGIYSWWIVCAIIIWLALGLLSSAIIARNYNRSRMGDSVPLDINNDPIVKITSVIEYGDAIYKNSVNSNISANEGISSEKQVDKSTNEHQSKKRGRPKKVSSTAPKEIASTAKTTKPRGRPKGSKNKVKE